MDHDEFQDDTDQCENGDPCPDGVGDACDVCPLWADGEDCTHTVGDIDDDGIATESDVCPYLHNPEQLDTDGDAIGDECDACPEEYNAEGAGCSYTIPDLRDPTAEGHPADGSAVSVNDVVVTGINEGAGFYVQDPSASEYAGIYVYDQGEATVEIGDIVQISGTYTEYYELSELAYATTTVTGQWGDFSTLAVSDPCSVGTGGELAEAYESMLISLENLTITDANPDGEDDYGESEVNGCLRVDDMLWDGLVEEREVDVHYSAMTGILGYTYSNSKLLPRGEEDVWRSQ
jgi:hypothetical protein